MKDIIFYFEQTSTGIDLIVCALLYPVCTILIVCTSLFGFIFPLNLIHCWLLFISYFFIERNIYYIWELRRSCDIHVVRGRWVAYAVQQKMDHFRMSQWPECAEWSKISETNTVYCVCHFNVLSCTDFYMPGIMSTWAFIRHSLWTERRAIICFVVL